MIKIFILIRTHVVELNILMRTRQRVTRRTILDIIGEYLQGQEILVTFMNKFQKFIQETWQAQCLEV